jgi:hypothetical protein
MDINLLLNLIENMSATDIISYCSTEKRLNYLCKKYSDVIWAKKLSQDFNISRDEIIGNPKSYYFGLKNKIGHYYFFDADSLDDGIIQIKEIKEISKEDARGDDNFFVSGILNPIGENIVVGYLSRYYGRAGSVYRTIIGKNLNHAKKELIKIGYCEIWEKGNIDENEINNLPLNLRMEKKIVPKDIDELRYKIRIYFFEAQL